MPPLVAGSDAHHWLELGVSQRAVHTEKITTHTAMRVIKEGLTGYTGGAYTPLGLQTAKMLKTFRTYYGTSPPHVVTSPRRCARIVGTCETTRPTTRGRR